MVNSIVGSIRINRVLYRITRRLEVKLVFGILGFCFVLNGQTATTPAGAGTSVADPYLITNLSELYWISSNNNANCGFANKYFKLVNDIDASATSDPTLWPNGWIAIGNWGPNGNNICYWFKGNFDGNGKSINGLHIVCGSAEAGLFGYLNGAVLNNFTLNVKIKLSSSSSQSESGALAGTVMNGCSFTDVHVRVTHSLNPVSLNPPTYQLGSSWSQVGGFVGKSEGYSSSKNYFTRCSVVADTLYTRCSRSGGFVGTAVHSEFGQCYADVRIFDIETYGATLGSNYLNHTQWLFGGFAGYVAIGGSFEDCYVVGEINGWHGIHGFAGTASGLGTYATRCFMGAKIKLWSWDLSRTAFNTSSAFYLGIFQVGGRGSVVDCVADKYAQVQAVHANFYSNQSVTTMTTSSTLGTQQAIYQTKNFVFPTVWSWDGLTNNGYPFLTSNSPTAPSTISTSVVNPSLSYTLVNDITLEPGIKVELNTLNLGTHDVQLSASSSGYSQLKFSSMSGSGQIVQNQHFASTGQHMISSSVASGFGSSSGNASTLYSYNAATGAWDSPGANTSTQGLGFFGSVGSGGFASSTGAFNVEGIPNTSNTINLGYSTSVATGGSGNGWNLIGNPYACGLDWTLVSKTNVNDAFYIWDPSTEKYNYYVNGVSPPSGSYAGSQILSAVIPPMQAFWVQSTSSGAALSSTMATAGTVNSTPTFYKTNPDNLILLIHEVEDSSKSDATWIKNVPGATNGFDGQEDAWKMSNSGGHPNIYSFDSGEKIAVNAIDFANSQVIPIGLDAPNSGLKYRLRLEQVVTNRTYNVVLHDKLLNSWIDILNEDHVFKHADWIHENPRFALYLTPYSVGTNESIVESYAIIYHNGNQLVLQSFDPDFSHFRILTLDGKEISSGDIHADLQIIDAPQVAGIYILELDGPLMARRQKFVITY